MVRIPKLLKNQVLAFLEYQITKFCLAVFCKSIHTNLSTVTISKNTPFLKQNHNTDPLRRELGASLDLKREESCDFSRRGGRRKNQRKGWLVGGWEEKYMEIEWSRCDYEVSMILKLQSSQSTLFNIIQSYSQGPPARSLYPRLRPVGIPLVGSPHSSPHWSNASRRERAVPRQKAQISTCQQRIFQPSGKNLS